MAVIRVIVEKSDLGLCTYDGKPAHYIEIDTLDYTLNQLSQGISNKIWDWARRYHISVNAFDELGEILDEITIR